MTKEKRLGKPFSGWISLYGGKREVFNDSAGSPRFTPVYCTKKQATIRGLTDAVRVKIIPYKAKRRGRK